MTNENSERSQTLFFVGQLVGIASHLNLEALEKILEKPSIDFRYAKECADVFAFAKQLRISK